MDEVTELKEKLKQLNIAISALKNPGRKNWDWAIEYLGFVDENRAKRTMICALISKERTILENELLKIINKKYSHFSWFDSENITLDFDDNGVLTVIDSRDNETSI